MTQKEREAIAKLESLLRKDIVYRGVASKITSMVVRGDSVFFSMLISGKDIDIERRVCEIENFLRRVIYTESRPVVFKPVKKCTSRVDYFNVRVWKNKGMPQYFVFGDDVLALDIMKKSKFFQVGIPTRQQDLDDGKIILLPSTKSEGHPVYFKSKAQRVLLCSWYSDFIRSDKYNVSIGNYKNNQCLILTPEL